MPKRTLLRNNSGFTLTEIVVTITIIGVLAALALPNLTNSIEKSRVGEGVQILDALLQAQRAFEFETGGYAGGVAQLDVTIDTPNNFNAIGDGNIHPLTSGYVATIRRSSGAYELCIEPDGDIACENLAGSPCGLFQFPAGTCP